MFHALLSRVVNVSNHPRYDCCFTHIDVDGDNEYHCTDKHGEHSKCFHGKSAFAISHNDIVSDFFEIGETLFLTNDGWSGLVKVKYFSLVQANILKIVVTNTNGDNIFTTKEHLRSPSNLDIGWVSESAPEYGKAVKVLSEEAIENLISSTHLSPLQQEFFSVRYKLNDLPFITMLRLAKMSILTYRFLKLRNDFPPCVSCLFGQYHRQPWRHKSSAKSCGSVLLSSDINKHGQRVGTYHIVYAQPRLVSQEKGSMTRACIWGATLFIYYETCWLKVHIIQDTSGDYTLEAKEAFNVIAWHEMP